MRLIDADALLERAIPMGWSTPLWVSDITIQDAPTVDVVERKKGKWISHYDYCKRKGCTPGLVAFWWCDQCERAAKYRTNFCPNCGAEMQQE